MNDFNCSSILLNYQISIIYLFVYCYCYMLLFVSYQVIEPLRHLANKRFSIANKENGNIEYTVRKLSILRL